MSLRRLIQELDVVGESAQQVADKMNAKTIPIPDHHVKGKATLLALASAGHDFVAVTAEINADPIGSGLMTILNSDPEGVNWADPMTQDLLLRLKGDVITEGVIDTLTAISSRHQSMCESAGLGPATAGEVESAFLANAIENEAAELTKALQLQRRLAARPFDDAIARLKQAEVDQLQISDSQEDALAAIREAAKVV